MNRILPIKFMATIEQQFKELIEFVEELPKTHSGKIRRVEIREKK